MVCWFQASVSFPVRAEKVQMPTEVAVKGGFTVTATTPDGVVMAIEDDAAGRWAVQFHPESILTAAGRCGHQVIANVLALCRARAASTA